MVELTDEGHQLIDAALADHVETQRSLLTVLTSDEIAQLDAALSKLMKAAEDS